MNVFMGDEVAYDDHLGDLSSLSLSFYSIAPTILDHQNERPIDNPGE